MAPVLLSSALPPLESTRSPWSCPYPLVFTRAQATAATDQCYRCSTRASVISDLHRLPLSLSQCLVLSLSPFLTFNISLLLSSTASYSHSSACYASQRWQGLPHRSWMKAVGGGRDGGGEGGMSKERDACRHWDPTHPLLQGSKQCWGERDREQEICGARIQHLLKGISPFIPVWKTAKEKYEGGAIREK